MQDMYYNTSTLQMEIIMPIKTVCIDAVQQTGFKIEIRSNTLFNLTPIEFVVDQVGQDEFYGTKN
jgi:hypothetical protein